MPATTEPPSDNPKDALQRYIEELWEEYLTWYNRASTRNFRARQAEAQLLLEGGYESLGQQRSIVFGRRIRAG